LQFFKGNQEPMAQVDAQLSTGLSGLDRVLKGLIPGDNIVWQVDSIDDYRTFVHPYCLAAKSRGKRLIYFRFARHPALIGDEYGAEICKLHPDQGFESFLTAVHQTIERAGRGACYVFDCLSDLAVDWYSDQMLGNFFMLTCPYLYDIEALAYFALQRNAHSFQATTPVSETAQVVLDLYRHKSRLYVHPLKVQQRYSPTMHMLHQQDGESFAPISDSAVISEILTSVPWLRLEQSSYRLGVWNRTFLQAEDVVTHLLPGEEGGARLEILRNRLLRMAVSRDERVLRLAEKYFTLDDVLTIGKRMIGTGLIGGKSVGMLLARAILRKSRGGWDDLLEPHDSFYIGSDVFYTFLVRNGIWFERQKQRDRATFLQGAERARQRMLMGSFPDYIERQLADMLDYFGQSPIIVRSSSLLEDNFGNAFAGKYDSVFCANQGPRHRRLDDLVTAVRTIYASTMSERALTYRAARGLLEKDEQMALLVQRVSGAMYEHLFFPQIAGVGLSFNPFVWSEDIDPDAGMLRLVFGLGTRAVDRSDDDYTRLVALNAPQRRPEANIDEVRQYAQRRVDVLEFDANQVSSLGFQEVVERAGKQLPLEMFASRDTAMEQRAQDVGIKGVFPWVLTFEKLFAETDFVANMRQMLAVLQAAYNYPVDVEFTANFTGGGLKINVVQCRPLQVKGGGAIVEPPAGLGREEMLLEAHGAVIGQSRAHSIDRLIYVTPSVYGRLPIADRYAVARLIGRLSQQNTTGLTTMLLGPGRWGTTTPSLGVPVTFGDISTVSVLCEIVAMRDDLVPDVSLGTHFLNELVELDMLYMALFPSRSENFLNRDFFEQSDNRLEALLPDAANWANVIRVIDCPTGSIRLNANTLKQRVVCYKEKLKAEN
jgi:hypothetical protein